MVQLQLNQKNPKIMIEERFYRTQSNKFRKSALTIISIIFGSFINDANV